MLTFYDSAGCSLVLIVSGLNKEKTQGQEDKDICEFLVSILQTLKKYHEYEWLEAGQGAFKF